MTSLGNTISNIYIALSAWWNDPKHFTKTLVRKENNTIEIDIGKAKTIEMRCVKLTVDKALMWNFWFNIEQ